MAVEVAFAALIIGSNGHTVIVYHTPCERGYARLVAVGPPPFDISMPFVGGIAYFDFGKDPSPGSLPTGQITITDSCGNSWGGTLKPTPPAAPRYRYDPTLKACVEDPNGQYLNLDECTAANPTSVTGGPVTCPPNYVKDASGNCVPDLSKFPEFTGNPLNPADIAKYLGLVISYTGSLISGAITIALTGIWNSLPSWIRDWFAGWTEFFAGVKEFFGTPGAFYRKHAAAMFEAGSGTPVGMYTTGNQEEIKKNAEAARNAQSIPWDIIKGIETALKANGEAITNPFDSPVTTDTADFAARTAALASLDAILLATAVNVGIEAIPTINATGIAFLTGAILQATGIGGYSSDYFSKKYDANIGVQLGYFWNEKYQNKIESMGNLISKRRKGLISNTEFTRDGVRVTGQTAESVRLDYKDSLQVPGLEDVLTYHFRHPTEPLDLGAIQDWLGINYLDYKKYFDERQFGDVSIRFIQSAANLLGFTEPQVRELLRLNRLDPRTNPVLQMSPLDVAVKVIMQRQEEFLKPPVEKLPSEKHFTYSLLIKLAEAGEDITGFMDVDLTAEGWDEAHRTVLEDYINATIAAKAAKTAAKTTPTA